MSRRESASRTQIYSEAIEPSDVTAVPMPVRLGRYVIRRRLGSGTFAAVYEATDPALDAPVAIKHLADHHSADPAIRNRFIREGRLLRKSRSSRLLAIHDIGEDEGQPFLVMELLTGGTLADRLATAGQVERDDAIRLVLELEACLAELRRVGIVHRDIKPSNLLVRNENPEPHPPAGSLLGHNEWLVLGDFGLARSSDATGLTVGGGTAGFMAPEQQRPGSDVDHRADLFAATVLVASALTGLPPEQARPTLAESDTPVAAVIARATAADPDQRYDDAATWSHDLRSALTATATAIGRRRSSVIWPVATAVATSIALALGVVLLTTGASGPGIVGPRQIHSGDSVVYTVDEPGAGVYYWTDWQGRTHEEPALRVTADGPGHLPITLTEVVEGEPRSTTIGVTVLAADES